MKVTTVVVVLLLLSGAAEKMPILEGLMVIFAAGLMEMLSKLTEKLDTLER